MFIDDYNCFTVVYTVYTQYDFVTICLCIMYMVPKNMETKRFFFKKNYNLTVTGIEPFSVLAETSYA